jgi:hypothetical protein
LPFKVYDKDPLKVSLLKNWVGLRTMLLFEVRFPFPLNSSKLLMADPGATQLEVVDQLPDPVPFQERVRTACPKPMFVIKTKGISTKSMLLGKNCLFRRM